MEKTFSWVENMVSYPRGWLSTFEALLISNPGSGSCLTCFSHPTRYRKQMPTWLSNLVPMRWRWHPSSDGLNLAQQTIHCLGLCVASTLQIPFSEMVREGPRWKIVTPKGKLSSML